MPSDLETIQYKLPWIFFHDVPMGSDVDNSIGKKLADNTKIREASI